MDLHVALLERIPVGVLVWRLEAGSDDTLRLVYANPSASELTGIDLMAREGKTVKEIFPGAGPSEAFLTACRQRLAHDFGALAYTDPRGHRRTLRARAFPLLDQAMGVVMDRLDTLSGASGGDSGVNRFLDTIIEDLPAMIFVKEARELRFTRFNRAGEELLGLSRDTLVGKTDHDFFPAEQADFFVKKYREVLAGRRLVDIPQEPIQTPRGTRWLHTRKIPIVGDDGDPAYLLGVSLDITERVHAEQLLRASNRELERNVVARTAELDKEVGERLRVEEQLRQSQKMEAIGRLAGGVAHDFNNLLTVILSYCDLALQDVPEHSHVRGDLKEIKEAGERASELTRQLLAFSRQQVLQPTVLDLGATVRGLERMLQRIIGEDVDLAIRSAPDLAHALIDRSQFEQVVMNLAVNARDAMPTGGKLTIEVSNVDLDERYAAEHVGSRAGRHVMLAVSDDGCGMTRETMARVFEPFFTTKERGKGTGLGLSTVFGIVQQSGGSVTVYSEVGKGTTFKVYVPVARPTDRPAPAPPSPVERRGEETILLVEDEGQVRGVVASILRRLGYTVLEAGRPAEALAVAAAHAGPIDLLITDVVMPEMGGSMLAKEVVAARPGLAVLFMSGFTDDAIVRHGVLEQGVEFVQKPVTPDLLARRVREVLARPRPAP